MEEEIKVRKIGEEIVLDGKIEFYGVRENNFRYY